MMTLKFERPPTVNLLPPLLTGVLLAIFFLSGCAGAPNISGEGGGIGGTGTIEDCSDANSPDSERCSDEEMSLD